MKIRKPSQEELKSSIITGTGHGHICHPSQIEDLTRREMLLGGTYLTGFALVSQMFKATPAMAAPTFPPAKRLVWINMSGGWDILESTDPKSRSTSGIDMMYDWNAAHALTGSASQDKVGRWLGRMAAHGPDMVVVRGMNMGTTSHMAGSIYMDTGVLSNTGTVNAASIPAIVASESSATIPIIQLNGGSDPRTDRGLLSPVSVVRAQNLDLYRAMYPQSKDQLAQKLMILDHLQSSIARVEGRTGVTDRLTDVETAQEKIRVQFTDQVGSKLALTDSDRAAFNVNAPANMNGGQRDAFALSLKLLKNNLVTCLNLGVGGFDTHANQERQMMPIMDNFDHLLATFVSELKAANQLDNTLIIVYSDFGRTPKVNNSAGRDHWPVGGALMVGGGIDGGRFVGVTDDDLRGLNINATTGAADAAGLNLNPTHLGGSILNLTLGAGYMQYRTYLEAIPALTKLKV
ncbi:MAG: DUF1501 domain-containing protein [Proteobacteria bacterium]|nr:MAG: DUF1501 domain-containing protein [Pseudomonadota bacterium]